MSVAPNFGRWEVVKYSSKRFAIGSDAGPAWALLHVLNADVHDPLMQQRARLIGRAPQLLDAIKPFLKLEGAGEFVSLRVRADDVRAAQQAYQAATGQEIPA